MVKYNEYLEDFQRVLDKDHVLKKYNKDIIKFDKFTIVLLKNYTLDQFIAHWELVERIYEFYRTYPFGSPVLIKKVHILITNMYDIIFKQMLPSSNNNNLFWKGKTDLAWELESNTPEHIFPTNAVGSLLINEHLFLNFQYKLERLSLIFLYANRIVTCTPEQNDKIRLHGGFFTAYKDLDIIIRKEKDGEEVEVDSITNWFVSFQVPEVQKYTFKKYVEHFNKKEDIIVPIPIINNLTKLQKEFPSE